MRYTSTSHDELGDGKEIKFGLGRCAAKGVWVFVHRDLEQDLQRAQPRCRIRSVDGFLVQGNGYLDDVVLFSGFVGE